MRNLCRPLLALILLSLIVAGCGGVPSELVGRRLDFRLPTLDGGKLGPPDLAETIVLVEFWATWCGPCHIQAERLEQLAPELESRGATVLSVNVGESRELVASYLAKKPSRWPVVLDSNEEVSRGLGVMALPTMLVLDGRGKVRSVEIGVRSEKVILELVEAAAGG